MLGSGDAVRLDMSLTAHDCKPGYHADEGATLTDDGTATRPSRLARAGGSSSGRGPGTDPADASSTRATRHVPGRATLSRPLFHLRPTETCMTTILHIDSSAEDADTSHSRRISARLVEALKQAHGDASVVRRDVHADQPPHVGAGLRASWVAEKDRRTPDQVETVARSEGLIDELKDADVVVIGSPMYNFTVPSTLKAWIDHVAIAGETFRYTEKGPQGLLENKKAYLALSSGGVYTEGPASGLEHLGSYLTGVLGFMGIEDVETVRAEGVAMGPDKDEAAMKAAYEHVDELVG